MSEGCTRREFLQAGTVLAVAALSGCAVNPVSGSHQLMLMSEADEIQVDRQRSPHQFSSDYGTLQDRRLGAYIAGVGQRLAALTHRPAMPYSFHALNATYVNAYAFPGGSIAVSRGILVALDNEAELAALLGHELGHVNARHTAQQMSKGKVSQILVGGVAAVLGSQSSALGDLIQGVGSLGAGALLASYSRDNEREADALGMEYMARAGYSTQGFVGLMEMLRGISRETPSTIELMFATHPMSDERYTQAQAASASTYRHTWNGHLGAESYLDHTAGLRRIKAAIDNMQAGEQALGKKELDKADGLLKQALKQAPGDYVALVLMARCRLLQQQYSEGLRYAKSARAAYPSEAQACMVAAVAHLRLKQPDSALEQLTAYERLLPGDPTIVFLKGYALEGMERKAEAASHYQRYLQTVREGAYAQHAYKRLVAWGYAQAR
jgi:predicted Zn-dependent protease